MSYGCPEVQFGEFLRPNLRPVKLAADQDANLVGMRWYGEGPFHRELKPAIKIVKKSHFLIRSGDVIYNKLFAWKGAFGIVPLGLDGMFVSDKFPTYELDRRRVDERFLAWYFRDPRLWEQARLMSIGSAAVSKLTLYPPKFLLLTMRVPELHVQRRVVDYLERLATEIEDIKALRLQAIQEADAVISSALHWLSQNIAVTGRLGDVLSCKPRNGWSAKCDNSESGVAVLSLGAVTGFRYQETEFKRTSLYANPTGHFWLRAGDLLITRSNTPELVGHAAIYSGVPEPCIYPDLMMRLEINPDRAETKFVWHWLRAPVVRDFLSRNAKGTSATMRKISQGTVARIPFPSDLSIESQRRVIVWLDRLQAEVDMLEQYQSETGADIDALLPAIVDRMFSGSADTPGNSGLSSVASERALIEG